MKWVITGYHKYDPNIVIVRINEPMDKRFSMGEDYIKTLEKEIGGKFIQGEEHGDYMIAQFIRGNYWVRDYEAYVNVWNVMFNIIVSAGDKHIVVENLDLPEDIKEEIEKEAQKSIDERGAINISGIYPLNNRLKEILESEEVFKKIEEGLHESNT